MLNGLSVSNLAIILVAIILSMGFHEAMHGFVSHWLGDTTAKDAGRLTLNPLKHIDIYTTVLLPLGLILLHIPPFFIAKPVPFNPYRVKWGEYGVALIGIAGPLTNLAIAVIASIFLRLSNISIVSNLYTVVTIFVEINVIFFIINMIPIPPLDGSRLLYAFAPEPLKNIMRQIESMGLIAIIIFMLILVNIGGGFIYTIENGLLNLLLG
jgi:Zn-dependent protease